MYLPTRQRILASTPRRIRLHVQILHVLEAIPQVTQEGVVQALQHPPLSYDVAHALRPHHFILAYVLERERQACVLPLHDPHLSKRPLPHHAKQAEVIEIDLIREDDGFAAGVAHWSWRRRTVTTGKDRSQPPVVVLPNQVPLPQHRHLSLSLSVSVSLSLTLSRPSSSCPSVCESWVFLLLHSRSVRE